MIILPRTPERIVISGFGFRMATFTKIGTVVASGAFVAIQPHRQAMAALFPEHGVVLRGFLHVTGSAGGIGMAERADILLLKAIFGLREFAVFTLPSNAMTIMDVGGFFRRASIVVTFTTIGIGINLFMFVFPFRNEIFIGVTPSDGSFAIFVGHQKGN